MSASFFDDQRLRHAASTAGFCVKKFAALLGMEVRTLERRFVQAFGCSPDEWLAQQRMREAGSLLERGFRTKEVAAALAYQHASSFFREFRRRYGCTPTEFVESRASVRVNRIFPALSQTAALLSQTATSPALPYRVRI